MFAAANVRGEEQLSGAYLGNHIPAYGIRPE
jgi:hypothetical protein